MFCYSHICLLFDQVHSAGYFFGYFVDSAGYFVGYFVDNLGCKFNCGNVLFYHIYVYQNVSNKLFFLWFYIYVHLDLKAKHCQIDATSNYIFYNNFHLNFLDVILILDDQTRKIFQIKITIFGSTIDNKLIKWLWNWKQISKNTFEKKALFFTWGSRYENVSETNVDHISNVYHLAALTFQIRTNQSRENRRNSTFHTWFYMCCWLGSSSEKWLKQKMCISTPIRVTHKLSIP